MADLLQRRKTYNLETYAPSILTTSFQGVTVTDILSEETARKFMPTRERHAQIFSLLPAGSCPNDPTAYDYYQLKTPSGQFIIVGETWIKPDSVELVDAVTYMVKITSQSAGDYNRIRNALLGVGINSFEITTL